MQDDVSAPGASPAHQMRLLGLARASGALVGLTFCLIVLGALVRANGAGLACPDWPLCFGTLVPRLDVGVGFEWTHRLVAGSVSLLFAALALAILRVPPARAAAGRALALAAGLLGLQVVLGALTVWKLLASWTVTAHLVAGNGFAASLLWIHLALRERAGSAPAGPPAPGPLRRLLPLAAAALALQVVLGGLVSSRYAGLACPEWPTCSGGEWFPSWHGAVGLQLLHRGNAYLLVALIAASAWAGAGTAAAARRGLRLLLALALAQVVVGVANVRLGLPVEMTALHSALGAALVLTTTALLRRLARRPAGRGGTGGGRQPERAPDAT
jgi:heme A synthase